MAAGRPQVDAQNEREEEPADRSAETRRRILLADDHRVVREALRLLIEGRGFEVVAEASDGREAIQLAQRLRPDIAVLDLAMPLVNGIEAAREIRGNSAPSSILMLTGSNSRADVDRARSAGAAGYVTKDRIAAELIDAIVEIAER